jgi:hypothetical protein
MTTFDHNCLLFLILTDVNNGSNSNGNSSSTESYRKLLLSGESEKIQSLSTLKPNECTPVLYNTNNNSTTQTTATTSTTQHPLLLEEDTRRLDCLAVLADWPCLQVLSHIHISHSHRFSLS